MITGIGCVTPFGTGIEPFWEGLATGRSAVRTLEAFDPGPYGCRVAGAVPDFRPRDFMLQREISSSSRVAQLSVASARMALEHAKLDLEGHDTSRVGVFVGTSIGTAEYLAANHAVFLEKGIRRVHPLFPAQAYTGVVATQVAINLGIRGPAICLSTACTSASDSVGFALGQIRSGALDCALAGGSDAPLTPILFASFDRLGVLSRETDHPERASRPFARDRDGFVMSEGAAVCVLEAEETARERGAPILGEVAGFGATSDGFHPFSPLPSGDEGARAIRIALKDAGVRPDEIQYISAHAIGSRPNDPIELTILRNVFGEALPRIPVSAIKSAVGHTMGACGGLELAASVLTLQTGTIPPTLHLTGTESENGVDLVPDHARQATVTAALSPTFGFGSRNGALVVRNASS